MNRLHQTLLIVGILPATWLGMMATHELGHVLGAAVTNGSVQQVVLHPTVFSRTDVNPNPAPLTVVWAGPLVGCFLPIVITGLGAILRNKCNYLFIFFAGACLIINGLYIGFGPFESAGDGADMLRHGSPAWLLITFGFIATALGLLLWHRVSPHFGFGKNPRPIDPRHLIATITISIAATLLTWLLGNPG